MTEGTENSAATLEHSRATDSDTITFRVSQRVEQSKICFSISHEGVLTFGEGVTPREAAQALMHEWAKLRPSSRTFGASPT